MPYGTCQGDYYCDSCKVSMPRDSLAWVDLKKKKLYCMTCRPEEALEKAKPPMTSIQRKMMLLRVLLKSLRKKNKKLETEVKKLRRAS